MAKLAVLAKSIFAAQAFLMILIIAVGKWGFHFERSIPISMLWWLFMGWFGALGVAAVLREHELGKYLWGSAHGFTGGSKLDLMIDEALCVYFEDDICVRLSFLNEVPQTARDIHKGDSYSQLIEQYGV